MGEAPLDGVAALAARRAWPGASASWTAATPADKEPLHRMLRDRANGSSVIDVSFELVQWEMLTN